MMQALSGQAFLRIWEVGLGQHALDRALTMLGIACPDMTRDTFARLSIGQRDTCLLALRELTFGSHIVGVASCPQCQERLEFALDCREMQLIAKANALLTNKQVVAKATQQVQTLHIEGYEVQVHLPNSLDLAALVSSHTIADARQVLMQRCIVHAAQPDGAVVVVDALPEMVITTLAEQMAENDPQAEIELELECTVCRHRWQLLFDIVEFFWLEITAQAKRLLREVHTLARAYSWRETDILAMSPARRHMYLEMVM